MTREQIDSLVRHILSSASTLLALFGLSSWLGLVDFLQLNLPAVGDAVVFLVGVGSWVYSFLRNKLRFKLLAAAKLAVSQNRLSLT